MSDIKKLMAAHHEKLLLETAECRKRTKELERENAALRVDNEKLRKLLQDWYDWENQAFRDRMNDRDPKEIC